MASVRLLQGCVKFINVQGDYIDNKKGITFINKFFHFHDKNFSHYRRIFDICEFKGEECCLKKTKLTIDKIRAKNV